MTSLAKGVAIPDRLSATNLAVEAGQLVAVIGPNGGGKTSLLRALARTEDSRGTVSIDGRDVDTAGEGERRRLLAFMSASREAPWPIRVADYIALGLAALDAPRLAELVDELELQPLADRSIDRLSTGERARAMLARALAGKARLLLLDEPMSNLDPYWVLRSIEMLRSEIAKNMSAALISVHDLELIERFDRVLLVSGGVVIGDDDPVAILRSDPFASAFRILPTKSGWAIRPLADPRSSR